jgi:hypothetical protein
MLLGVMEECLGPTHPVGPTDVRLDPLEQPGEFRGDVLSNGVIALASELMRPPRGRELAPTRVVRPLRSVSALFFCDVASSKRLACSRAEGVKMRSQNACRRDANAVPSRFRLSASRASGGMTDWEAGMTRASVASFSWASTSEHVHRSRRSSTTRECRAASPHQTGHARSLVKAIQRAKDTHVPSAFNA